MCVVGRYRFAYTDHTYSDRFLCCGVVVRGVLLSGSFYMYPTVECILCNETVYIHSTLHEAVSSQVICKAIHILQH